MTMPVNMPLYFNCFFFDKENKNIVLTYKIESTDNMLYPFQLFRQAPESNGHVEWVDLSIYASIRDSVSTFLNELSSRELSDEIYHRQASVEPEAILEKIEQGNSIVSIYDHTINDALRMQSGILFENLIQRNKLHLKKVEK